MDRVVAEVQEEGLSILDRCFDMFFGFASQSFRQKDLLAVVLFQAWYRMGGFIDVGSEALGAVIAPGLADRRTSYVDIKAELGWIATDAVAGTEVSFADMDGSVTRLLHQSC